MSLDVYLEIETDAKPVSVERIFIRKEGSMVEISREEWDRLNPGREPFVAQEEVGSGEVFWANITHNLAEMADAAGLYEALWRPDEAGFVTAGDLIEPLEKGLDRLLISPSRFKEYNPANGWGDYNGLVSFVERYLTACRIWPEAKVRVSR